MWHKIEDWMWRVLEDRPETHTIMDWLGMRVNHWAWLLRCWKMRYWSWYYRVMPDSVTLALCAVFGFCAAAAIFIVAMTLFGIWSLVC